LALLDGKKVEVRLYLQDVPTAEEITEVLRKLDRPAIELTRTGEADFKTAGLSKSSAPEALIEAMVQFPKLIERPVVINGDTAAIGRPPESVLSIL